MKPDTLLLVDGHNLLCKAFFGLPLRLRPDGFPVHGTLGFTGILLKMINYVKPTHLAVIFDPDEVPARTRIYPEYKSNRQDYNNATEYENPFTQLADIKMVLEHLDVQYLELPGYEADDVIASLADKFNGSVVISSTDTDFFQLISEQVGIFSYRSKYTAFWDETAFLEKYGIPPCHYVEFKAMVGDVSDNIPGIRGIGPKTAVKVISGAYLLSNEQKEVLQRNIRLITLDKSVPLSLSPEVLRFTGNHAGYSAGMLLKNLGIL